MDKDKILEFLDSLELELEDIEARLKTKDDRFILKLEDSDEYAYMYSVLDKYPKAEIKEEGSMTSEFATVVTYLLPEYKVMLNANFVDDYYCVVIKEDN